MFCTSCIKNDFSPFLLKNARRYHLTHEKMCAIIHVNMGNYPEKNRKENTTMKKFFAILLSAALLVSMFVVFAPASEAVKADITVTVANGVVSQYQPITLTADLDDDNASETVDAAAIGDGSWYAFQNWTNMDASGETPGTTGTIDVALAEAADLAKVSLHLGVANVELTKADGSKVPYATSETTIKVTAGTVSKEITVEVAENTSAWVDVDLTGANTDAIKIEFVIPENGNATYSALVNEIDVYVAPAAASSSSVASSEVSSDVSSEVSSDVSSEVSSDVSSEVSSDVSSEVSSDVSSEESSAPAESLADQLAGLVGEDNAESMFDMVINAPETYVPGESITVEVTIANVQAIVKEGGAADGADMYLHLVEGQLFYNNEFLTLTNTVEEGVLLALEEVKGFEDWCKVKADNQIEVSALTEKTSASYSKKDGELVFKFTFDVSADATGDLGFYITSESVWGSSNAADGNAYGTTKVVGNGSYAIISEYVEEESSSSSSVVESSSSAVESSSSVAESTEAPTPVEPGDASVGFVVFAILAVVAIAGSAVVIKSRR